MNDQSRTTRARIIETAMRLFYEQGYAKTGIAQILKAAKVNSGSLYHFFPSKEDLLVAVLEDYKTMLDAEVFDPVFERVGDPIERVFAVLDGYRAWLQSTHFRLGCPIGNFALEVSNTHPRVCALIAENFEAWCERIRRSIEDAAGRLPPGADPSSLARYVLVTMEGAVMLARAYRSFEPFDQAVEQLRDHFERLMREGTEWSAPGPAAKKTRRNSPRRKVR